MMQSAAVLPTESPVKSLPEILGVPLQRKTFCLSESPSRVCRLVMWTPGQTRAAAGEGVVGEGMRRLNHLGLIVTYIQAGDVSCSSVPGDNSGKSTCLMSTKLFAASPGRKALILDNKKRLKHLTTVRVAALWRFTPSLETKN